MPAAPKSCTTTALERSVAQPLPVPGQLGEPDRCLAAEGDRHGGLSVRPAGHHRRPVELGLCRELVAECIDEGADPVERPAEEERHTGVHDVLGGRPPVDVPGRLGGGVLYLLEERQDRIADDEGALAEALEVDPARDGRGVDRRCGLRGDDPGVCLRVGERPLDLEPRRRRSTPPRRAA